MPPSPSPYEAIDKLWSAVTVPPISRHEATRAAQAICRHFGAVRFGGPSMTRPVRFRKEPRRCWISRAGGAYSNKGWPRLVHDLSHRIFARRHPNFRPHAAGHATLEREIAEYVIQQGWLAGTLRRRVRPKPSQEERRAARMDALTAAIDRWDRKCRRAENALRKLKRRQSELRRQQARSVAEAPAAVTASEST